MSAPEGAFTRWWADRYTRRLPDEVRDRRRAEIECDVFEHLHLNSESSPARRTSVAWRAVRGIPADVAWRRQEMRAMRSNSAEPRASHLRNAWAVATQRWFAPLAVLVLVFDILSAIAVVGTGKGSGQVIGPVLLTLCALSIGTGLWLRWRSVRGLAALASSDATPTPVSRRTIGGIIAVLLLVLFLLMVGIDGGSIPVFLGALVLLGGSALVVGIRVIGRALRSSDLTDKAGVADGLIIVGTFPALGMFWMIVPTVVALLVIGGVLGTSPRFRPAA